MNAQARPSPLDSADLKPAAKSSGEMEYGAVSVDAQAPMDLHEKKNASMKRPTIGCCAKALGRLLVKRGNVEVVGFETLTCDAGALVGQGAEVSLLVSQGNVQEDLVAIQRMRGSSQRSDFAYGIVEGRGDFCQRLHQQGNRESLLLVGTNREEPPVPQEAQDRGGRPPEHGAEIPHRSLSAVIVR
jgi:hypothetical protein